MASIGRRLFQMSAMANVENEFYEPLTRQGTKTAEHKEGMSICSSTPQAPRWYINSSLLESALEMGPVQTTGHRSLFCQYRNNSNRLQMLTLGLKTFV